MIVVPIFSTYLFFATERNHLSHGYVLLNSHVQKLMLLLLKVSILSVILLAIIDFCTLFAALLFLPFEFGILFS